MAKVGFLGCGKIGSYMADYIREKGIHGVSFVQDPFFKGDAGCPVIVESDDALYAATDLVVECATADVLKQSFDAIIERADMLIFSVTAFSDADFMAHAMAKAAQTGHHIYFPHGAILGLDGLSDGAEVLTSVTIETTKSPKSLGRTDTERTVVYDGPTRDACKAYPRNVNVHASVALATIGFDRVHSRIIADPAVSTNTHVIKAEGEGIHFVIEVSSFTTGGVTGKYTPISACGSLDRALGGDKAYRFV